MAPWLRTPLDEKWDVMASFACKSLQRHFTNRRISKLKIIEWWKTFCLKFRYQYRFNTEAIFFVITILHRIAFQFFIPFPLQSEWICSFSKWEKTLRVNSLKFRKQHLTMTTLTIRMMICYSSIFSFRKSWWESNDCHLRQISKEVLIVFWEP